MKHALPIACSLATLLAPSIASSAPVSSHREAPFIAGLPKVDATDFYMFKSYEPGRGSFVTLVANYLPLQDPYGGPNYFQLDPSALYQIHVDNDGDSREDITFTFRFHNTNRNKTLNIGGQTVSTPLIQSGQVTPQSNANLNVVEAYTLSVVFGDQYTGSAVPVTEAGTINGQFEKPVDYIGTKTLPDYETYASDRIYKIDLPGDFMQGRVFVGQRKDPFVVNLGELFDLVNTDPLGPPNAEHDDLADKNVTSLVLEVPMRFLFNGTEQVVGGWTTASMRKNRMLSMRPSFEAPAMDSGDWVQVSRLGMPLVNEVVIGLKDKNDFNVSRPSGDAKFFLYVTNPTLPAILQSLFGVSAPCTPRNDLVQVFLTGLPGINQPANVQPAEMLRLNLCSPITPKGQQHRLGLLAGDPAGFPNGRRPGDDVVDITLRAAMGVLLDAGCAPSGELPYTDGAYVDDSFADGEFPYLRTPIPGSPHN